MKSLYIEPQLGSRVLVLSVDLEAVEEEGGDEAFAENWQEKKDPWVTYTAIFIKKTTTKMGCFSPLAVFVRAAVCTYPVMWFLRIDDGTL